MALRVPLPQGETPSEAKVHRIHTRCWTRIRINVGTCCTMTVGHDDSPISAKVIIEGELESSEAARQHVTTLAQSDSIGQFVSSFQVRQVYLRYPVFAYDVASS